MSNNQKQILVGFDGFIDEIFHVVATRSTSSSFERFQEITPFAQKVADAAGRSCNFELTPINRTIGGNAPLMTQALNAQGCATTLLGCLGLPTPLPLYDSLIKECKQVISLAEPGITEALEFQDGKLLFGRLQSLQPINFSYLIEKIGEENLLNLFQQSDLIATVNWTMLSGMTDIWQGILRQIAPLLSDKRRTLYIDLADPTKRSRQDLQQAVLLLQEFSSFFSVILGLNISEAQQVLAVLTSQKADIENELELAIAIRKRLPLHSVLVHSSRAAALSSKEVDELFPTPHITSPTRTTGAGDHFNAGFCREWVENRNGTQALRAAIATASYYVRTGTSPHLSDLT